MTKLLLNTETSETRPYPRADDQPVTGLQPPWVAADVLVGEQPAYDSATQELKRKTFIDTVAATVTYGWEAVDRPPAPVIPRWVEFGNAVMADPDVNAMLGAALTAAPGLYGGLTVGMGKAADGDSRVFLGAWTSAHASGLISAELIGKLQLMGAEYDLPQAFITALDPTAPPPEEEMI